MVTGDDDRYAHTREHAMKVARSSSRVLLLYDIDAPTFLGDPLPTWWSGEGSEGQFSRRLDQVNLRAAGRATIADQVAEAEARLAHEQAAVHRYMVSDLIPAISTPRLWPARWAGFSVSTGKYSPLRKVSRAAESSLQSTGRAASRSSRNAHHASAARRAEANTSPGSASIDSRASIPQSPWSRSMVACTSQKLVVLSAHA